MLVIKIYLKIESMFFHFHEVKSKNFKFLIGVVFYVYYYLKFEVYWKIQ